MMDKTEKRLCLYSAILLALILNIARLLALRENGILIHYWHFDLGEYLFQLGYCFLVTYFFLRCNLYYDLWSAQQRKKYLLYGALFCAALFAAAVIGGGLQRRFISTQPLQPYLYWGGYISRFMIDGVLCAILVKIVLLMRENKHKAEENAALKTAFLQAELETLKGQLNPHFLFNSLSSLSGIIREDPQLAQHYLAQLSKVFRYSLQQPGANMVPLSVELNMATAYGQLLTMRFEQGFELHTEVDDRYLNAQLPHLSVQLLVENAAKHNSATLKKPLSVNVFIEGDYLVVSNNLQETNNHSESTGIGLANLSSRCKILTGKEPEIIKTAKEFLVKVPLRFEA